jgi:uncharacterized protein YcbK (DUF882 family)
VRVCAAQKAGPRLISSRAARRIGLAVFVALIGWIGPRHGNALGDNRTISLHNVHTGEDLTVTYKKNGRYDDDALNKINWILRDWRKNQAIKIDPESIDLLWEVQREVGAKAPIHIICGYRSSETNAMLRRRSKGVARFSQHTLGKAIDFFIPGVPLDTVRAAALRLQGGGVGYYPASGAPFVHLDVGSVRHWPRMTREQLAKIFPDGRTVHLPADGNPLPGYQLALADLERGQRRAPSPPKPRSLFAALFGSGQDLEEKDDNASIRQSAAAARRVAAAAAKAEPAPTVPASAATNEAEPAPVPLPPSRPIFEIASAERRPAFSPRQDAPMQLAALTPSQIVQMRGRWDELTAAVAPDAQVSPGENSPAAVPHGRPLVASSLIAAVARDATASIGPLSDPDRVPPEVALAYAAQAEIAGDPGRAAPMGRLIGRAAAAVVTNKDAASIAVKPSFDIGGKRALHAATRVNDPWLRALLLVASVQNSMTVTTFGDPDFRYLVEYMRQPDSALVMIFSREPYLGMMADAFTGSAVVFQATATFSERHTASLR